MRRLLILLLSYSCISWSEALVTFTENGAMISDSERGLVVDCLKTKFQAQFQWDIVQFPLNKILKNNTIMTNRLTQHRASLPATEGNIGILLVKNEILTEGNNPLFSFYIPDTRTGVLSIHNLTPPLAQPDWKKLRAQRLYKLATRLIASSLRSGSSGKCILQQVSTAEALDKLEARFCPDDLTLLREVSMLKSEKDMTSCELDGFVAPPIPTTTTSTTTSTTTTTTSTTTPATTTTSSSSTTTSTTTSTTVVPTTTVAPKK